MINKSSIKVFFGVLMLLSLMIVSASAEANMYMVISPEKYNYVVGDTIVIGGYISNSGPDVAKEIIVHVGGRSTVRLRNISINGVSGDCQPDLLVCTLEYKSDIRPYEGVDIKIYASAVSPGKDIDILADVTSYNAEGRMDMFWTGAHIKSIDAAPIMKGDVNLDKHVTIRDALFIARYKADLISLTPDQLKAADTNDDGKVTITDALFIAKWLADPSFKLWDPVKDKDMLQPVP